MARHENEVASTRIVPGDARDVNDQWRSSEPLDGEPDIPDGDSNFYTQELPANPTQAERRWLSFIQFAFRNFIVVVLFSSLGGYQIAQTIAVRHSNKILNTLRLSDAVYMTRTELVRVVTQNHLHVYWQRPDAQKNARCRLNAVNPTAITLTIVLGTPKVRGKYAQFITYAQKNAFKQVLAFGRKNPGGTSFISTNGNSIYYTGLNPESVYVGIKNKNFKWRFIPQCPEWLLRWLSPQWALRSSSR